MAEHQPAPYCPVCGGVIVGDASRRLAIRAIVDSAIVLHLRALLHEISHHLAELDSVTYLLLDETRSGKPATTDANKHIRQTVDGVRHHLRDLCETFDRLPSLESAPRIAVRLLPDRIRETCRSFGSAAPNVDHAVTTCEKTVELDSYTYTLFCLLQHAMITTSAARDQRVRLALSIEGGALETRVALEHGGRARRSTGFTAPKLRTIIALTGGALSLKRHEAREILVWRMPLED